MTRELATAVRQEDENLLALLTDDIVNLALLPRLSCKALIILSMTCRKGQDMVDNAPLELCLW